MRKGENARVIDGKNSSGAFPSFHVRLLFRLVSVQYIIMHGSERGLSLLVSLLLSSMFLYYVGL